MPPRTGKIRVNFINMDNVPTTTSTLCYTTLLYDVKHPFGEILQKFANKKQKKMDEIEWYGPDKKILRKQGDQFTWQWNDESEIWIHFKEKARTTAIDKSNEANQRQQQQLQFEDKTGMREPLVLHFDRNVRLSTAINQIANIYNWDLSYVQFFNSRGDPMSKFNQTKSQYLKSDSATIQYIDESKFFWQEVDSRGIMCGFSSLDIDESTTIDDILDLYEFTQLTQVVQVADGQIHQVVEPSTKVRKLIDDGYIYRVDQYEHTDSVASADTFNICVKFIGNSPKERLQTPLLLKVSNGARISAIGLQIAHLIGFDPAKVEDFLYYVDSERVGKEHVLVKPEDPKVIRVVLLDMKAQ